MESFLQWIKVKALLHFSQNALPHLSPREFWWAALGRNIGSEINGKNTDFTRPVLIMKKLSRSLFLVIPATTQAHSGTWYVPIFYNNRKQYLCLHQMRVVDIRRFTYRIGQISPIQFKKVKEGFDLLYK